MALLKELSDYRMKIMQAICSDQEIVNLINGKDDSPVPDRSLIYKNVFPYAYVPEKTTETDTYVCFRFRIPEEYKFKTTKKIRIIFYMFSHQSHIRTKNGLRPDLIAERIENLFNGNINLGISRMELKSMDDINPSANFHGLAIEYEVVEYDRPTINGNPRAGAT